VNDNHGYPLAGAKFSILPSYQVMAARFRQPFPFHVICVNMESPEFNLVTDVAGDNSCGGMPVSVSAAAK